MEDDKVIVKLKRQPLESERREIKAKRRRIILTVVLCLLCVGVGLLGGYLYASYDRSYYYVNKHSKFDKIMDYLSNNWLYKNDYEDIEKTLEDNAYYGMADYLNDPYTTYMSSEELEEFSQGINLNFVGIGVTYVKYGNEAIVTKVFKDSPAERAGFMVGDIIVEVDGITIDETNIEDLKSYVQGIEGTSVNITVLRQGEKVEMTAIRGQIDSTVYSYAKDDYVYLEISSFGEGTAAEIIRNLDNYPDYKKIIIDLRDDTGGYQTAVEEIAGLFIGNDKVYMSQEYADGSSKVDYTDCSKTYTNFEEYVVLINANTASAAEVLTICLKEQLPNITLVGETTYGKGVVQTTVMIEDDSALKYTTSKWLSPNGVWVHGEGIAPDVEVLFHDVMYTTYFDMDDDEEYGFDSVSDQIRTAQMCLDYLGYKVDRQDGYMSSDTLKAIKAYQNDSNLQETDCLNRETYYALISKVTFENNTNIERDVQLSKAIEIIEG